MKKSGGGEGELACLENELRGLGLGAGEEEQKDSQGVEHLACRRRQDLFQLERGQMWGWRMSTMST